MKKIYNFLFGWVIKKIQRRKLQKQYKKKLEELRKRDPSIYKNH